MWFTADPHYGHASVLGYCDRPFPDVAAMNAALLERHNDAVRPDDDVLILGDLALGTLVDSLALVAQLHGRKLLVPGNHDRCWPGHRKGPRKQDAYTAAGIAICPPQLTMRLAGVSITACHFPYHGDSYDADRFDAFRPHDAGGWLLHGHVHTAWRQDGRCINVGVDAWNYMPVHADTLAALITAGPSRLNPLVRSAPLG